MEGLGQRDLRQVIEFLGEGYAVTDLDSFAAHVTRGLRQLIGCDVISYNEVNPSIPRAVWNVDPIDARFPDQERIFASTMHEHPLLNYFRRTGDGSAIKVSDFLTSRQFHRLGIYNEFYRRAGLERVMAIVLPAPRPLILAIAALNARSDLTERQRVLLNLLRPHLARAYANAERATLMQRALGSVLTDAGSSSAGALIVTRDGHVREATTHATQRLARYFGNSSRRDGKLPDELRRWVAHHETARVRELPPVREPFVVEGEGARLVVRLFSGLTQSLLLFEERPTARTPASIEPLGLSRREAEVLAWVAEGKTNPEIATILGLSSRTVQHHVEHILSKLGVETRTAAVARALQQFGGRGPQPNPSSPPLGSPSRIR